MALRHTSRLLLWMIFLLSFCVSELASTPTLLKPTDAVRVSISSMRRQLLNRAVSYEGPRYQHRSLLNPAQFKAACPLTEPSTSPIPDAKIEVMIEENIHEQIKEEEAKADTKLIHERAVKQVIGRKPTVPNSLKQLEDANVSTEAPPSDSAGEAQDDEKAKTKEVGKEDVDPIGKLRGHSGRDFVPHQPQEAHVPSTLLPPISPGNDIEMGRGPDTNKNDTDIPKKGTQDKRAADNHKDDIAKQSKGGGNPDFKQESSASQKHECEESHCQDAEKVLSACLRTSGEGEQNFVS